MKLVIGIVRPDHGEEAYVTGEGAILVVPENGGTVPVVVADPGWSLSDWRVTRLYDAKLANRRQATPLQEAVIASVAASALP